MLNVADPKLRMKKKINALIAISLEELNEGSRVFQENEPRDVMYKTATFLVDHFWGKSKEMADGLGVLLLTWNQSFYRFGSLDFSALENCLTTYQSELCQFRERNILSYTENDDKAIENLYDQFLIALQFADGKSKGKKSPVAVAKALHLLAPNFFPLWDNKISKKYNCCYNYISFIREMKRLAEELTPGLNLQKTNKTFLKLIDEYNYAKYTKFWI